MIFAFADDCSVCVFDTIEEANTYCEGIDVENGLFTYLDERGHVLRPLFTTPNERKKYWYFSIVRSGTFVLEPSEERRTELFQKLESGKLSLEAGPTKIRSLDDLRRSVPTMFQL